MNNPKNHPPSSMIYITHNKDLYQNCKPKITKETLRATDFVKINTSNTQVSINQNKQRTKFPSTKQIKHKQSTNFDPEIPRSQTEEEGGF